jgi:hypothetical protein
VAFEPRGDRPPAHPPESDDGVLDETCIGDETVLGTVIATLRNRLELCHDNRTTTLFGDGGSLSIGRDPKCSMVVNGHQVSRRHAEIVCRSGIYTNTDSSANGTFVVNQAGALVVVNRRSEVLSGSGKIGLGVEPGEPSHTLTFRCIGSDGAS